jgi:cystathionine beta-synthase
VGSLTDTHLFSILLNDESVKTKPTKEVMQAPFTQVSSNATIEEVSKKLTKDNTAVILQDKGGNMHIITKYDVIQSIAE